MEDIHESSIINPGPENVAAQCQEIPVFIPYNTGMEKVELTEIGRNFQNMVRYCLTIPDRAERTECACAIARHIAKRYPRMVGQNGDMRRVWDIIQILSDFKLDIDFPCEVITAEKLHEKPSRIPYNTQGIAQRVYGRHIVEMIGFAVKMEEGEQRDALILSIANQMKRFMLINNRQSATDARVLADLSHLSGGVINLDADSYRLDYINVPKQNTKSRNRRKKK